MAPGIFEGSDIKDTLHSLIKAIISTVNFTMK